jgi:hypothetical protein
MAIAIPTIPYILPAREVFADDNPFNAKIKQTAENKYKNEEKLALIRDSYLFAF